MRKATDIERILCDMRDLCVSVANGNERIVSAWIDKDDDLIVRTTDEKSDFDWQIGFGSEDGAEDED
jgi:hypothetical protein